MAAKVAKGLGKGLDALLRSSAQSANIREIAQVDIHSIQPNRFQPRREFNMESLQELADSIAANGILEPLLVRPQAIGYELVAGERRLRAAKMLDMSEVPAIICFFDDRQTAEIALVENLQREDLHPLEEAFAYRQLLDDFSLTQEELAKRVGKSRSHVANTVRLLQLPAPITDMLMSGALEMGHARSLLSLPMEKQLWLAGEVESRRLNVRQTEALVRQLNTPAVKKPKRKEATSAVQAYWLNQLKQHLQTQVRVQATAAGGHIEIDFYDADDLERLLLLILQRDEL